MSKPFVPKIVSANHLLSGRTMFLKGEDWTEDHRAASVATTPEDAARLLRVAEAQAHVAVGPYLVDVRIGTSGAPEPIDLRELMRISGPSIKNRALAFDAPQPR